VSEFVVGDVGIYCGIKVARCHILRRVDTRLGVNSFAAMVLGVDFGRMVRAM
jgi:hypothetical protein